MNEKEWELLQEMKESFENTIQDFMRAVEEFGTHVQNFEAAARKQREYPR